MREEEGGRHLGGDVEWAQARVVGVGSAAAVRDLVAWAVRVACACGRDRVEREPRGPLTCAVDFEGVATGVVLGDDVGDVGEEEL